LVVHVEIGGELLQADPAVLGEQRGQLGDTGVELVHVGVQLDAVAGGQHGGLGSRLGGHGVLRQLGLVVRAQRGTLQDADRGTAMAQSDGEKAHAGITVDMSPSGPWSVDSSRPTAVWGRTPSPTASTPALRCSWK